MTANIWNRCTFFLKAAEMYKASHVLKKTLHLFWLPLSLTIVTIEHVIGTQQRVGYHRNMPWADSEPLTLRCSHNNPHHTKTKLTLAWVYTWRDQSACIRPHWGLLAMRDRRVAAAGCTRSHDRWLMPSAMPCCRTCRVLQRQISVWRDIRTTVHTKLIEDLVLLFHMLSLGWMSCDIISFVVAH